MSGRRPNTAALHSLTAGPRVRRLLAALTERDARIAALTAYTDHLADELAAAKTELAELRKGPRGLAKAWTR